MYNFLSIIWYKVLPAHYGGQKDISRFNQHLGLKVHLTALCSSDNKSNEPLSYKIVAALPVSKTQFFNPATKKLILNQISRQHYSHVILEHPYHAWIGKHKKKWGVKLIVHAHNIEFLRMKQRKKWWWPWVKYVEKKAFDRADFILFKTNKDLLLAKDMFNVTDEKSIIVPYGTDISNQSILPESAKNKIRLKHNLNPEEKIILFAGTPDYEPNIMALHNIVSHIIPKLQKYSVFKFRILICGNQQEETINQYKYLPEILFTGFVDSIDEYLQSADVFINPVTTGSGIQTKNIEAIANGLSVSATQFASTGLPDYLHGNKLLISDNDNWEQFAQNIIELSGKKTPTPSQFYTDFYWGNIIDRILSIVL